MIFLKAPKGTYSTGDVYTDGSKLICVYSNDTHDYLADNNYLSMCAAFDKASFTRATANPTFKEFYMQLYTQDKKLTAVWLNSALQVDLLVTDIKDLTLMLDKVVTETVEPTPTEDLSIIEEDLDFSQLSELGDNEDIFSIVESGDTLTSDEDIYVAPPKASEPIDETFMEVHDLTEVNTTTESVQPLDEPQFVEPVPLEENSEVEENPIAPFQTLDTPLDQIDMSIEEISETTEVPQLTALTPEITKNEDIIFEYKGELPEYLIDSVIALIKGGKPFKVRETSTGHSIDIE